MATDSSVCEVYLKNLAMRIINFLTIQRKTNIIKDMPTFIAILLAYPNQNYQQNYFKSLSPNFILLIHHGSTTLTLFIP